MNDRSHLGEHSLRSITPTIDTYIKLAQYPILADRIRERMRQELFRRGIINPDQFEREVEQLSLASQRREGLANPFAEEDAGSWQLRKERIRDFHTDAYYANNLGSARLDMLIEEVLSDRSPAPTAGGLNFNPEIAPWELLFKQGEAYERLPAAEREPYAHHLEEIKVVLIKRLMSDQLPYIGVAKHMLTVADLHRIHQSLIGTGKIGGKAAGMILAWRILQPVEQAFGQGAIDIPDSYFIGTDVIYEFFLMNRLEHYMNQKYRPIREIREEYPRIVDAFLLGRLPDYVVAQVAEVLASLGNSPLIVRSSSLLEDNFGFSFAGKYSSYFCPNQDTPEANLACVLDAIRRIYASTLNPDALLYRKNHNLIDYDERMAILIQRVSGRFHGRYFYPDAAGLAFSQNPFNWAPEINPEDGFMRIVAGLGTRAVERVSQDYPRLIPLSHPELRPEQTPEAQRVYSQRLMAVVDCEENKLVTVPFRQALAPDLPGLSCIVSTGESGVLEPVAPGTVLRPGDDPVITFDGLARNAHFISMVREVLDRLEEAYNGPVDVEFALDLQGALGSPESAGEVVPHFRFHILECRPMHKRRPSLSAFEPAEIQPDDVVFSMPSLLPAAHLTGIRYLVFIDPDGYYHLEDEPDRLSVSDALTHLNDRLPVGEFAIIGPGRWGSLSSRHSVPVSYSDICNSRFLVEISPSYSPAPELAFGTDFYEDLTEAGILVLGMQPGGPATTMRWDLLREASNDLAAYLPEAAGVAPYLRVIDLAKSTGAELELVVDDAADRAIGYLIRAEKKDETTAG